MYAACLGIPQIISWILRALSFLLKPQKAFFCPWMMAEGEAQRRARQFLSLMFFAHTNRGETALGSMWNWQTWAEEASNPLTRWKSNSMKLGAVFCSSLAAFWSLSAVTSTLASVNAALVAAIP